MSVGRPKPQAKNETQTLAIGFSSFLSSLFHLFLCAPAATASNATPEPEHVWPSCMSVVMLNEIIKSYLAYDIQISSINLNRYCIFNNDEVALYNRAYEIARVHVLKGDGKLAEDKVAIVVADDKHSNVALPPTDPWAAMDEAVAADPRVLRPTVTITVKRGGVDHKFQGTLEQIAMANLGFTVACENPAKPMVSEGRAERLRVLRKRFLPDAVPLALEQARLALPKPQDGEAKEAKNTALNSAFNKIKENKPAEAQAILKAYVKSTQPAVITDGSYYLNLLQAYIDGLHILLKRASKELPNDWDGPYWDGPQGRQYFCALGILLRPFSMDLREIFMTGAWSVLHEGWPVDRGLDTSDGVFCGAAGSNLELGVLGSYDDLAVASRFAGESDAALVFFKLISAITSAQQILCCNRTLSSSCHPSP